MIADLSEVNLLDNGSQPDMEKIISRYGNSLYRMAFMYLKDVQLAEDALQETFLKIYKNYSRFRNESDEKTWMSRIAINVCKDMLRQSWRKVNITELIEDIPADSFPDSTDYDGLMVEIMKLPDKYREIILLHYYQDMKTQDIAQTLGIPIGTVLVRLKRARDMLAKNLEGWY